MTVHAVEDAGVLVGTAVLALNGSVAGDVNASELQTGDAEKGLCSALDKLSGGVRLALESGGILTQQTSTECGFGRYRRNRGMFLALVKCPNRVQLRANLRKDNCYQREQP